MAYDGVVLFSDSFEILYGISEKSGTDEPDMVSANISVHSGMGIRFDIRQ